MRSEIWKFCFRLRRLLAEEEGQDLIEYALVASLISVAAIGSIQSVATSVGDLFNHINTTISNAVLSL